MVATVVTLVIVRQHQQQTPVDTLKVLTQSLRLLRVLDMTEEAPSSGALDSPINTLQPNQGVGFGACGLDESQTLAGLCAVLQYGH